MIVNTYAVLDGFVGLLRLGLGLVVILLTVTTWRRWRAAGASEMVEDRYHLVFLLAGLLLALNVLA